MTPDEILSHSPHVLSEAQRASYFDDGGICVRSLVDDAWLGRCRAALDRLVDSSRAVAASDAIFDVEPAHSPQHPRLRRVNSPCDHDVAFWDLLVDGPLGDLAADLLGPDVKFYQSKLNFKSPKGGTEVRWHQDAPFFPHTNHAVLTMGVYLEDCSDEHGPLEIIPGSHKTAVRDHYDRDGEWRGEMSEADRRALDGTPTRVFAGPAGSVTVHNYRTIHGSKPNVSSAPRPLLLYVLSAADAMPYTAQPLKSRYEQAVVRGEAARHAHHEPGHFRLPPDWSGGYTSIFALQQKEALGGAAG